MNVTVGNLTNALHHASSVVDTVIQGYSQEPVDLLCLADGNGEYAYIENARLSYSKNVLDIVTVCHDRMTHNDNPLRVLEIGAFLGVVSISLARLGCQVTATDIPMFIDNPRLVEILQRHAIKPVALNLRDGVLPFKDNTFDLVIMCDTLEHLNFNPLPLILEINRVLVPSGNLYLSLPNLTNAYNRFQMLLGKSHHNPIEDFFAQLDRSQNMIAAIHWREYTMAEIKELLERMGFVTASQEYFDATKKRSVLDRLIKLIIFSMAPSLKGNQIAIARKEGTPHYDFWQHELA